MGEKNFKKILQAREIAQNGIDYSSRWGAVCPYCKTPKAKVITSKPWEENMKIRYHKCLNKECLLFKMEITIKSIEEDKSGVGR